jgi:hypothetical protein
VSDNGICFGVMARTSAAASHAHGGTHLAEVVVGAGGSADLVRRDGVLDYHLQD